MPAGASCSPFLSAPQLSLGPGSTEAPAFEIIAGVPERGRGPPVGAELMPVVCSEHSMDSLNIMVFERLRGVCADALGAPTGPAQGVSARAERECLAYA